MSTLTHDFPSIPLGERISTTASRFFRWVVRNSDGARCARHAIRLSDLSDADLAARGIRREDIIRIAFARHMHY